MVGVEGEHAEDLTTTTANNYFFILITAANLLFMTQKIDWFVPKGFLSLSCRLLTIFMGTKDPYMGYLLIIKTK